MKQDVLRAALLCAMTAAAAAQWSNNSSQNSAIGDLVGEQAVPKIAARADGGCFVGWFDNSSGAYQLRLQRLDVHGTEQWPHNGIVVSAHPQSTSLQDWDLIVDSGGNAVLAFTDTRTGPDLDVFAYRIDPTGAQLWGANGVTLSANGDAEANPHICQTAIGDFAFAWSNSGSLTLRLQRLDLAGVPLYPQDGIGIAGDVGANPGFVRICASDAGAVILSWVRTLAFTGNKHIHAQKFDFVGTPLWNGGLRLPVFDSNSVPIAHDPKLQSDGIGGAILSWHFAVGQAFSARIQHLDANGVELFVHNGIDVQPNANSKFDPAVAFDVTTQSCTVVWNERNSGQTSWGIVAQKFDAAGAPQWSAGGVTLRPIDGVEKFAPVAVPYRGGAMAFQLETTGTLIRMLRATRVDSAGVVQWGPVAVSSALSDKLRVAAAVSSSGMAMLCWGDARPGNGNDIYAQSVGANGVLAPSIGDVVPFGCGGNPAGSLVVVGRAALGSTVTIGVDNPAGTQTAGGSLAVVALSPLTLPTYPCGLLLPGYGMSAPGAAGEVLVDVTQAQLYFGPLWQGPGQPAVLSFPIPLDLVFYGAVVFFQGALVDLAPGAAIPIGLTTASRWSVGF